MTTDFTSSDLDRALDGEPGNEYTHVRYEVRDDLKSEPWVDEDKTTAYLWAAKKDADGYPVVFDARVVSYEDDDFDEDMAHESASEFLYEGGYLHPYGYFKVIDQGNLGDGHEAWALIQHQESGRLFRKEGYYSSWDSGQTLDGDFVEVEEADVTVVRYRSVEDGKIFQYPAVDKK